MKTNDEITEQAREALSGKWGFAILYFLVASLIIGGSSTFSFIITGPISLGLSGLTLKYVHKEEVRVEQIFDGFSNFATSFLLFLVISIFTILWTLLFVIPGIIATLAYSQAFYLLAENPTMEVMTAIRESKRLMYGHKGQLFGLYVRYFLWGLLCILTLGIGFLWLIPYMNIGLAAFYESVVEADARQPSMQTAEV